MATRKKQSDHDNAVAAIKSIYESTYGKHVVTNPGSTKNQSWNGYYIDVIVKDKKEDKKAWIIEVETDESINETEAKGQWSKYDNKYKNWYMAIPKGSKIEAEDLFEAHEISNCTLITWVINDKGNHVFTGLPGRGK